MPQVKVTPVTGRDDLRRFIELPYAMHRDEPNWVGPLRMEVRKSLSPKHNPFLSHADSQLFVARTNGKVIGRISAHVDHRHNERHGEKTGMFGWFEAPNDPAVAEAMLNTAKDWVQDQGMERVRGPLSWSMHEYFGVLVDGFDTPPMIMMGHNPQYYDPLIQDQGFGKVKDVYCYRFDAGGFTPTVKKLYEATKKASHLKIRKMDMKRFDEELRTVFHIYNEAWKDNWGFTPITEEEIKATANDLKMVIEPDMALIAEVDGKIAAMAVALPNIFEATRDLNGKLGPVGLAKLLWRLKVKGLSTARLLLLGILPEHRGQNSLPILMGLYGRMNENGENIGIKWGELSWTLEDNHKINESITLTGATRYKTYRLYETGV